MKPISGKIDRERLPKLAHVLGAQVLGAHMSGSQVVGAHVVGAHILGKAVTEQQDVNR